MTELLDRPAGTGDSGEDGDGGGGGGVDAFGVLGLSYSPELTDGQVRRAYLARLRVVHPDAGGDAGAAAAVTAAYVALRSGVRRGELLAGAMTDRGEPARGRGRGRARMRRCRMRRGARSCAGWWRRRGGLRVCRRISRIRRRWRGSRI